MEQQVSWAAGRGLMFISVVQLALSVLNRLMVLKDSIKVRLCLELSYLYTETTFRVKHTGAQNMFNFRNIDSLDQGERK
jgi:hypothetical protein